MCSRVRLATLVFLCWAYVLNGRRVNQLPLISQTAMTPQKNPLTAMSAQSSQRDHTFHPLLAFAHALLISLPTASWQSVGAVLGRSFFSNKFAKGARSASSVAARGSTPSSALTTSDEIIPRDVLFSSEEYSRPLISPDGTRLLYLRPDERGVANFWCRTVGQWDDRVLQSAKGNRGFIKQVMWAEDSKTVLYVQDQAGNENYHIYAVDIDDPSSGERDLTPFAGVKAKDPWTSARFPNQVLFSVNKRNPDAHDVYRYDLQSNELSIDTLNPGNVVYWGVDSEAFDVRAAVVQDQADASKTIRVRDDTAAAWRDLANVPFGDEFDIVRISTESKSMIALSSLGRETRAMVRLDTETGKEIEVIASDEKSDCEGYLLGPGGVLAATFNYARREKVFFDEGIEADFARLQSEAPDGAETEVVSRSRDDEVWIVTYVRADGPQEFHIFDRQTGKKDLLFYNRPKLLGYKFAPMEDVRIPTRDGLEIVGYLTRASTEEATALVLLVHGGPHSRDRWGFNLLVQWLANRGYAVLQVNYRASSGYGKTFQNQVSRQRPPGSMQHDLSDSVKWAIKEGIALKDKVCIYGTSYGGYACLCGLTFTPDLYACGVSIAGISNYKTRMDAIPEYWALDRIKFLRRVGDVDDAAYNQQISPIFHVDNIRAPLMLSHGARDTRLKQEETDRIAFKMKEKGIPVEYVLYPDEGHGIGQPKNCNDFAGRTELFLAKHLGGRAQPFVKREGSTAQFPLDTGLDSLFRQLPLDSGLDSLSRLFR